MLIALFDHFLVLLDWILQDDISFLVLVDSVLVKSFHLDLTLVHHKKQFLEVCCFLVWLLEWRVLVCVIALDFRYIQVCSLASILDDGWEFHIALACEPSAFLRLKTFLLIKKRVFHCFRFLLSSSNTSHLIFQNGLSLIKNITDFSDRLGLLYDTWHDFFLKNNKLRSYFWFQLFLEHCRI